MRLTQHEDGYIYGVFCSESKDTSVNDLSAAVAAAGIVRTKDLKTCSPKLIVASVGAADLGCEKLGKLLDQCVARGEVTVEKGRVLNEELKRTCKQAAAEGRGRKARRGRGRHERRGARGAAARAAGQEGSRLMAGRAAQLDEAKRASAEIVAILQKHHLVQGPTPEEGPRYFRETSGRRLSNSDKFCPCVRTFCPKNTVPRSKTLRTGRDAHAADRAWRTSLTQAYARPWQEVFSGHRHPAARLGLHRAGARRDAHGRPARGRGRYSARHLYDTTSRDVRLLKRAAALLSRGRPLASALDFHAVLDEIWHTVQEELDFTIEANNIAEFKRLNDGVAYADCPATFPKWCTKNVLVMEYIAGHQIDDPPTACAPTGMISTRSPSSSCTTTSARSRSTAFSTPTPIPATSACRAGRSSGSTSA